MYFPQDSLGLLRHPSQLYEAFFEGLVLFAILWALRHKIKFLGWLSAAYLTGYGIFRLGIEFFRDPDPQIGLILNFFTLGQLFSLVMIMSGAIIFFVNRTKKGYNGNNE
jgi:phosphatidylglycerol:prolipoprotein diacylglycerol transferase